MEARNGTGRLFVFGWDGADWAVIEEGWRRGHLPELRKLVDRGCRGTLMSTIPPITSVAWTSFLTGCDPGEHGIFGFRAVDPTTYRPSPVAGGSRRVPTLMQGLDEAGYRTCLVTVPWTYPADPLAHGAIVPGWDAPDERLDSCHPPELAHELAAVVDRVPRRVPSASDKTAFLEQQERNIELRERIGAFLIERVDPHVFMTVFSEPDQGAHHLWSTPAIPEALLRAYEQVDRAMGRLIATFVRDEDVVLVVSDHGSRPLHTFVHVGQLLTSGGWLSLADAGPVRRRTARGIKRHMWNRLPPRMRNLAVRALPRRFRRTMKRSLRRADVDWENTVAFPVGSEAPGIGVCINVDPPFARGAVTPDDYRVMRDRVAAYLRGVADPLSGRPVFARVAPREEVYVGDAVNAAPDLVLVPQAGYGVRPGMDFSSPVSRVAIGEHRPEGIYAVSRPLELAGVESIPVIRPKVLAALGFPFERPESQDSQVSGGYSSEETEEIEARLRDLGYIE